MTFLALAMLAAGCTQEALDPQDGENGHGSVTVDHIEWVPLSLEGEATRISIDNTTGVPSWTTGDQVAVHTTSGSYQTCTVDVAGNTVPVSLGSNEERDGFAVYPATAVANNSTSLVQVTYPDSYDLSSYSEAALATLTEAPCPMVAINTPGSALKFRHVGGIIRITLENVPAGTTAIGVMSVGVPITGTAKVSNPGRTDATSTITDGGNVVTFYLPGERGLSADRTVVLNIPVPTGTYAGFLNISSNYEPSNSKFCAIEASNVVKHGTGIKLSRDMTQANEPISSVFSVGYGTKVAIAPGNLQYTKSTDTWSFMDHQYDIVEEPDQDVGYNYANQDIVSLFCWATSGYNDTYPYMTTSDNSYYCPSVDVGDWTWDSDEWDWGVHNRISNGGDYEWRTLTISEWKYLLNSRFEDYLYAKATVNGICGLIVFPDGFDPSLVGITIVSPNSEGAVYDTNTFNYSDWIRLQYFGCAFLPAAGRRNDTYITTPQDSPNGYYWSSSSEGAGRANLMRFYDSTLSFPALDRRRGFSVRLVRDIIKPVDSEFSVGANKKVAFAHSNLQYDTDSFYGQRFKFAEFPWDYLGTTTEQNSDHNLVDRDLFGWATSGYNDKYPYMTSTTSSDYLPTFSSYPCEWTSDSAEWDWGVHNIIINGGGYSWRTLTIAEWQYLFEGRTCWPRYAMANVAGVNGLILFPDDYIHPSGVSTIHSADTVSGRYSQNVYDAQTWSSLAQAGCVFLPAAGHRMGTDLSNVGEYGYYWSSTASSSDHASCLFFVDGEVHPTWVSYNYRGCSVRLVRDIN